MKKVLFATITWIISFVLLTGCSSSKENPVPADKSADVKETVQEQEQELLVL